MRFTVVHADFKVVSYHGRLKLIINCPFFLYNKNGLSQRTQRDISSPRICTLLSQPFPLSGKSRPHTLRLKHSVNNFPPRIHITKSNNSSSHH